MKQMKFTFLLVLVGTFMLTQPAFSMIETRGASTPLVSEKKQMNVETFINLTPAKYQELTGQKLGWAKKIQLKMAQKLLKGKKAGNADISKGLYVVLALIGFGWLAMGLLDDWSGSDWIISLVLYFLFFLPGLIYTLIKMKKYY